MLSEARFFTRSRVRSRVWVAMLLAVFAMPAIAGGVPRAAAEDQPGAYIDVTEGVHRSAIDELAAKGLFEGTLCGDGEFCPTEPIKRSTMAVWLVRALEDSEPSEPRNPRFVDVAAEHPWAGHIERLAQLSVTVGCASDPLRYCPQESVTRAEMATFLTRAFELEAAEPIGFADLNPESSHNASIDALAAAGITVGCASDPLRYCPQESVTRAEMATFLVRAINSNHKTHPAKVVAPPPNNDNPPHADPNAGSQDPDPPPPQEPVDPPPDNGDPPDADPNAGSLDPGPPPQQEPVDPPSDNGDPPDDDDEGSDCDPDGLCFIPLTEEEWRQARERIFGD